MKIIKDFIRRIMREEVEKVAEDIYQERVRHAIQRMEYRVVSLVKSSLMNEGFNSLRSTIAEIKQELRIGISEVNKKSKKEEDDQ
jgi:hypothetical protein